MIPLVSLHHTHHVAETAADHKKAPWGGGTILSGYDSMATRTRIKQDQSFSMEPLKYCYEGAVLMLLCCVSVGTQQSGLQDANSTQELIQTSSMITLSWNGTLLSQPIMVFRDEILVANVSGTSLEKIHNQSTSGTGTFLCSSTSPSGVSWHFTNSDLVPDSPAPGFQQTRATEGNVSMALLSRGSDKLDFSSRSSGLWACRLSESTKEVLIGLYRRNESHGSLIAATVILLHSSASFMSDSPSFTIIGRSQGGPPTDYVWTKDGAPLNDSAHFNISIKPVPQNAEVRYQDSIYESSITITGRSPGLYQYSVSNRLSAVLTDEIYIEVADCPSSLTVRQIGDSQLEASWVPPPISPRRGYVLRITNSVGFSTEIQASNSPHSFAIQSGVYDVRLRALSEHYPSDFIGPVNISVRSLLPPLVSLTSLTPTFVEVNITQPEDSLPPDGYMVALRLASNETQMCESHEEDITIAASDGMVGIANLSEFSVYNLTVTSRNVAYSVASMFTMEFMTLSTLPSGPPQNITFVASARSVFVTWAPISCELCNGPIIAYEVRFGSSEGELAAGGLLTNETFNISGIQPYTNYTFQVAGVNENGTGPFSEVVIILTDEAVPGPVSDLSGTPTQNSVELTWTTPEEPNGIVISYEVTYRINSSSIIVVNTTNLSTYFTISSLTPGTTISNMSVSAYTRVGRGEPATLDDLATLDETFAINFITIVGVMSSFLVLVVIVVIVAVVLAKLKCFSFRGGIRSKTDFARGLSPRAGPVIHKFPGERYVTEGESVLIKVTLEGNPRPNYTWIFGDNELRTDSTVEIKADGSLFIPHAGLKHRGQYRLLAKNHLGNAERSFNLYVKLRELRRLLTLSNGTVLKPVPLKEYGEYVADNHLYDNKGFKSQFVALFNGQQYSKFIGTCIENAKLNRYANIIVYDHNRVLLEPLPEFTMYARDYINASYIDGYASENEYIATQGPKPETIVDFWRLVWQEKPPTIVMVTNLKEGHRKKCDQYWPESGSIIYGPFQITLTEQKSLPDYCIRTFLITLSRTTKQYWELKQYHYMSWNDHGLPEYSPMIQFHKDVASWHQKVSGPMLVHCSAGVGRTGAFICLEIVLEQIRKEKVVDIAGVVNKMRHQRMKMVHFLEQYIYLHDVILKFVECGNSEININNFKSTLRKWIRPDSNDGRTMLEKQFRVLEQISPKQVDAVCMTALENPDRNRAKDYLPSDRHRVILSGETPDYIHALYINGYDGQKAYVIAEGPMESTVRNMYKVIYDKKCGAIIMLSNLAENSKECSFRYWPLPLKGKVADFGEYRVSLLTEDQHDTAYTTRMLRIHNLKSKQYHEAVQYQISCWKHDGYCSDIRAVLVVCDEVLGIMKKCGRSPIFVHCSDTITRSSMFCVLLTIIRRWRAVGVVDVFRELREFRLQKPGAVPTLAHYQMIYNMVIFYMNSALTSGDMVPQTPSTPPQSQQHALATMSVSP